MTPLSASDFGRAIVNATEQITRLFVARVADRVPAARTFTYLGVKDHLGEIVGEVGRYLGSDGSRTDFINSAWLADQHGLQRAHNVAYSLDDVLAEYLILRQIMMSVVPEGRCLDARAADLFVDVFIMATCKSTEIFVKNSESSQLAREREQRTSAELMLQKAVDVAKVGFFDWNMQTDTFEVSAQFRRDWGVENGVNLGEIIDLMVPEDRAPTKALIDRAAVDGQDYHAQYRIRRKTDGVLVWIDAQGRVTNDEAGRPHHFFGTTIDITAQKEFESETTAMVDAIPQLAWMADANGHLYWYNQRWQDFTGASQEQMKELGWAPFHHPDHFQRAAQKWFDHLERGEPWEDIFPLRGKSGEYRMFLSRAEPIKDLQNKITRWFGTNTDITEALQTEKDLTRLAAVVESSGDFIAITDAQLNLIFINSGGRKMVGFGSRDITQSRILDFFEPEDRFIVENEVLPTLLRDGFWQGELRFRNFETGAYIPVIYNLFPIRDLKTNELVGYATNTRDITERIRLEEKTIAAKDEAEQANRAKSAFLANMSHEIRTPIGAIMGFSDLARQPETSPADVRAHLSIVERNSVQVLRIIDDILDLAKVEAGRVDLEQISFSLLEFLADFSSLMGFRARENGIRFEVRADSDLPNLVTADPTRLRQILTNAVGNALKFTVKGSVILHVAARNDEITFRIIDTGRGISPEQGRNLFRAFVQADVSTTRKFGGTGLGLVLTKRLCQLMGGDYVLERSKLDVGSTFTATVVVELTASTRIVPQQQVVFQSRVEVAQPTVNGTLDGVSVLLVEDSPDNQELFKLILERQGAAVEIASNGLDGYTRALAEPFDVVLMDIQMPLMDGHEAIRKLRKKGYEKPVVALTAHAMREEIERAQRSGFSAFLTKPVQREALISTVRQCAEPNSAT